jgi:hypothetical protein
VAPGNEDDVLHLFDSQPKSSCKSEPDPDMLNYPLAKIPSRYCVLALDRCRQERHCPALPLRAHIRHLRKIVWPVGDSQRNIKDI